MHRCLQRHGISRLPEVAGDKPAKQPFKAYPIGYFHIDIAEVRTEEGKLHLFVAMDRTSKYAFARLMHGSCTSSSRPKAKAELKKNGFAGAKKVLAADDPVAGSKILQQVQAMTAALGKRQALLNANRNPSWSEWAALIVNVSVVLICIGLIWYRGALDMDNDLTMRTIVVLVVAIVHALYIPLGVTKDGVKELARKYGRDSFFPVRP